MQRKGCQRIAQIGVKMKTLQLSIALVVLVLMTACGNSSKNGSYENNPFGENTYSKTEEDDYEQESQMVTCPMCNGTGIFDFMPGDTTVQQKLANRSLI